MSDRELYEEGLLMDLEKAKARIEELEAENVGLKAGLSTAISIANERGRYAPIYTTSCDGWKCSQPWCVWCSSTNAAEAEVAAIKEREATNRAILAELTGGKDD